MRRGHGSRGGQFRAGVQVELFQGGLLVEVSAARPAVHGQGLPAGDLVLAEDLQEVQVYEFAGCRYRGQGAGSGRRGRRRPKGHPLLAAWQGVDVVEQCGRAVQVRSGAAVPGADGGGGGSVSAPAARMPLIVR